MNGRFERIAIEVVVGSIMVSAIAGSVGLISGGLPLPLDWLAGTPFVSYTVPAAMLVLIVGGSALAATSLMLLRHPLGVPVALVAGLIQVGWIVGERLLAGTPDFILGVLQVMYFVAGATRQAASSP